MKRTLAAAPCRMADNAAQCQPEAGSGELMDLSGKVVIVTGAGNGIGREYARAFAAEGAAVVVADIDDAGTAQTVATIVADDAVHGSAGRAIGVHCDITSEDDVTAMVRTAVETFGGIDVLVNNAGLHLGRYNECSTLPIEEWRRILDVNVLGALICARECRATMARALQ